MIRAKLLDFKCVAQQKAPVQRSEVMKNTFCAPSHRRVFAFCTQNNNSAT